jgi:hypothetical protein
MDLINATKTCSTWADCCDSAQQCNCLDNGTPVPTCPTGHTCTCSPSADCDGELGWRSLQIDPTDTTLIAAGAEWLFRATDGGATGFKMFGRGTLHDDHNALTFSAHNMLFDGNDGGIWQTSAFSPGTPLWSNLNGNLANIEFYAGAVDALNYGVSVGGTQDNGHIKGGNPLLWSQLFGGDSVKMLIDPTNSNIGYATDYGGGFLGRNTDGGSLFLSIRGNPSCPLPPLTSKATPVAMDPGSNTTLVAYSVTAMQVYRTTNATAPNPQDVCWQSITTTPATLPTVLSLAMPKSAAPPSNLIFAAAIGNVWRTTDAGSWTPSLSGLPNATFSSIAIDLSLPCNSTSCTLYVTASGFSSPGNVFRSTDSGQTWTNISGTGSTGFPTLPANKIVVHPSNSNVVYVATDMGVYQGTLSGGAWSWGTFSAGMPQAVMVNDLAVHVDAGLLRAFTYGRSAWESQPFPIPNGDLKVNTVNPVTTVYGGTVRVSSGTTGQRYAVGWLDDRNGANNWHVYFRGYTYDGNGNPTPMSSDLRVDDTSTHVAQSPDMSGHPTDNGSKYYARFAWQDDRLAPAVNQHIYTQYIGTDGYKLFNNDLRVDQQATNVDATNPAVAFQPSLDFAVAWQAQRGAGSSLHDIYARFFGVFGTPKGNQFLVNTSALEATRPATAFDASNNVFVAWEEFDSAALNGTIMISKYDPSGTKLRGPVQVDNNGAGATERHEVALAVDGSGNIIATWWERKSDGTQPETVFRRRFTNALDSLESETQVDQPPSAPPGANRATWVGVATDTSGNFAITWQASVNDPTNTTWNVFARSFNSSASTLKNDFRIDLASRTAAARAPRAARSSQAGRFAYAWSDNRSGHYDVYTRVVPSLN